jgi:hypothetical protein
MPDKSPSPPKAGIEVKHSCTVCHRRKVKCDRGKPCSNCVKNRIECEYKLPSAPRRRVKSDRRLIEKIRKYEDCLERIRAVVDEAGGVSSEPIPKSSSPIESPEPQPIEKPIIRTASSITGDIGLKAESSPVPAGTLLVDSGTSRYLEK